MTRQQIAWAMGHDWFIALVGEQIMVWDGDTLRLWTGTFRELRDWAGY